MNLTDEQRRDLRRYPDGLIHDLDHEEQSDARFTTDYLFSIMLTCCDMVSAVARIMQEHIQQEREANR